MLYTTYSDDFLISSFTSLIIEEYEEIKIEIMQRTDVYIAVSGYVWKNE